MDRLGRRKVNLDDSYAPPANFLEIEVHDPVTHGIGNDRFTEYTVQCCKLRQNFSSQSHFN